jgi:hypothetical protein
MKSHSRTATHGSVEDVNALVEVYAKATATLVVGAASKSNPLPASAADILALPPQQQAEAVLLLMRRIAAVRQEQKGAVYTWWNYVVCRPPFAGLMMLLHQLLRRKLPYPQDALAEMVRHTADLRDDSSFARGEPTANVIKAVRQYAEKQPISSEMKAELLRLNKMLGDIVEDRKIAVDIENILAS